MNGRSIWLVAAGVFAAVLGAAGIGYLIGSTGGSNEAAATTTTTTSTTTTEAPVTTVAEATTSTTTTAAPETSEPPPSTDAAPLVSIQASHPDALDILDTYERFVTPINEGRAADAFVTLGPSITRNNTPAAWASGQQTSVLHEFTVVTIADADPDTRDVRITFRSTQDGEFGRLPGETCTLWDITHTLVRSPADPAPIWLINRSSQNDGSPQAC